MMEDAAEDSITLFVPVPIALFTNLFGMGMVANYLFQRNACHDA